MGKQARTIFGRKRRGYTQGLGSVIGQAFWRKLPVRTREGYPLFICTKQSQQVP
jgi:hypothetical protein